MPADRDPTDFERFLGTFPERDEGHDVVAARDAWERATGRTDPETIIAGAAAYAIAMADRERLHYGRRKMA